MLQAQDLSRAAAIDREEFLYLVQPVLHYAHRLAYGMLRSPTEAEDVVQEATLKAWSKIKTFEVGTDFKSWFLKVVANECRQTLRSGWWKVLRKSSVDRGSIQSPQDQFVSDDGVRQALSRLSYDHRVVIVLRYYLDLSFEQVGTTLGISPRTAKSRTHRALARLRPMFSIPEVIGDE
jgi:RNA polymerase sigma-70 factor (ECF subfamily)